MTTHIEIIHELEGGRYPRKVPTIEPDLGDLRKSTDKALPAPPKTAKRVLMKYRFSAFFPIFFSLASFVLVLVLVLAGHHATTFSGQYLVSLHDPAGERAPEYQDATKDGIGTARVYYLYLHKVCYDSSTNGVDRAPGTIERRCESYSSAAAGLVRLTSSAEAHPTNSGVPTDLANRALIVMSIDMADVRKAIFASLVVSLIGSIFSAIWSLPGLIFPHSGLLAYINMSWPLFSSAFTFLAAIMLSIMVAGVFAAVDTIINVGDVEVRQGGSVLLLIWLAWVLVSLSVVYWGLVWFVEVRRSSFVRRKRSEEEVGNWKGIGREVWMDFKVEKTI